MRGAFRRFSHLVSALAVCWAVGAEAGDWPHWRGPDRSDVTSEESGWNGGTWPANKPIWRRNLGSGSTSPIVANGQLFTLGWNRDGKDGVHCVDAATGEPRWSAEYACPQYGRHSTGDKSFYAGPCSTPEFDPPTGFLYTLSIDGHLNCWDTKQQGRLVWSLSLYDKYHAPQRPRVGRSGRRDYGYTSSPLLQGDALIVEVGAEEALLMAFDKHTGRRLWKSQATGPAGHNAGPTPILVQGVECVATLSHNGLLVARIDPGHQGQTVAEFPWRTEFANNIASPAISGASVVITSAYNHYKMARLDISLQGAEKVWETKQPSKVCTPIIHQGRVYWAWRDAHCLDFATGKTIWDLRANLSDPGSCILTADNRLIMYGDSGRLLLVDCRQGRVLAEKNKLFRDDAWPHVVLANGLLYCKDKQGAVQCFNIKQKPHAR